MLTSEGAAWMLERLFSRDGWTIAVTDGVGRVSASVSEVVIEPVDNGAVAHVRASFSGDGLVFAWTGSELVDPDGVVADISSDVAAGRRPTGAEWNPAWEFQWEVEHVLTLGPAGASA